MRPHSYLYQWPQPPVHVEDGVAAACGGQMRKDWSRGVYVCDKCGHAVRAARMLGPQQRSRMTPV